MRINPVTFALLAVFLYPVIRGFVREYSSGNLKSDLENVENDISFIISLAAGVYYSRKIFVQHESGIYESIYKKLPSNILQFIESKPFVVYITILPVFILIIYYLCKMVLGLVNYLLFHPLLDHIERVLGKRGKTQRRFVGAVFELPKAFCYVLFLTFILNFISILNLYENVKPYLAESAMYNYICSKIVIPVSNSQLARQLPSIINNSFKIEVRQASGQIGENTSNSRAIVYYNGVTLDEGIKSNSEIDRFARELTKDETSDKGKARKIYTWIGSNLSYDYEKANEVLNNDFEIKSGAIPAFEYRKGICFDYSCLYVAMSRAVGLKVRLVTGEGFNGSSWVSHAWNQVYISKDRKWINVDTTFYKGGNYFGSSDFYSDHRNANVVGEW